MEGIVISYRHEAAYVQLHVRQSTIFSKREKAQAWLIGEHGILMYEHDEGSWQTRHPSVQ